MNLLAHLHLSDGCDPDTLTANVMADYLGRYDPVDQLDPLAAERLQPGIDLHRQIDSYTDQHPVVAEARDLVSEKRRRLAGIIVDIAFDYYLSRHWQRYSDEELSTTISRGYATMAMVAATCMSSRTQSLVSKMRATDWLSCYGTEAGQKLTYERVSRRSEAITGLIGAEQEFLPADRDSLWEDCFLRFYPDLVSAIATWKQANL